MPTDPKLIRDHFLVAAELPTAERATYLNAHCGDAELRAAVERLLAAHDQPASVLERPAPPAMELTAAHQAPEQPGLVIAGRYKLLEDIGEGGMGTVWVAEQTQPVRRKVALKLIKAGMDSHAVLARFEAERQALALMDHPNIAKVLDGGATEAGRPFFVMEYIKGLPITDYCEATRLSVPERLQLFVQVCTAVQHAHQKGIIHRDLKPSNILVAPYDDKPVPKVIDFGLAKALHQSLTERTLHTAHETVLGTPLYMSPEQAQLNNLDVDTRSDIYSLGVLLYELLTGTTPLEKRRFKDAAWEEVKRLIREEEPPRPSARLSSTDTLPSLAAGRQTEPARLTKLVRGELDWIVMKALEKDRGRRYETANGFAADVQRHLAGEPVQAAPPGAAYRLRKFVKRHKGRVAAGTLVLLALLAGLAATTWQWVQAEQARDEAEMAQHAAARQAEGERQAKLDAQAQKARAEKAAAAEKAANAQTQRRLTQIEKANEILGSIFENLDPKEIARAERPLQAILVEKLDRAVELLEGEAIGDPLVVATMQAKLGKSLMGLGAADKAVVLLEKARAAARSQLGPEDPETLGCMCNVARAYQYSGKLDRALTLFEETLRLMKAKLKPDHPYALMCMNSAALAYLEARKMERAAALLEQTLRLMKVRVGPDHPDTLIVMNNLGLAYVHAGELDQAIPLLKQALALWKARHRPDHPGTLGSMNTLAAAYRDAGKLDQAISLLEQTFQATKAWLGPDHPETLRRMNNLAATYWSAKHLDRSIPLLEETLKRQERTLGRDHPDTLMTVANLAANYQDAGRHQEALPLLEEAARAARKYPRLGWVGGRLPDAYAKAGAHAKLAQLLQEQLAVARRTLPGDSPRLASLLARLSMALLEQKKAGEAEPPLRECLAILQKTRPDAWITFDTQAMLGAALLGQKKYAEAEPLLRAGYEGMTKREAQIPPQGKARLTEAVQRLVQIYEATGKNDEGAKWRQKLQSARATGK
jgi:tetratricopeptide (TPR) repeat protein